MITYFLYFILLWLYYKLVYGEITARVIKSGIIHFKYVMCVRYALCVFPSNDEYTDTAVITDQILWTVAHNMFKT